MFLNWQGDALNYRNQYGDVILALRAELVAKEGIIKTLNWYMNHVLE